MGFEPQTSGQPLVNVRKRTTKVNFAIVIGVIIFLAVGLFVAVWVLHNNERGDTIRELPAPTR